MHGNLTYSIFAKKRKILISSFPFKIVCSTREIFPRIKHDIIYIKGEQKKIGQLFLLFCLLYSIKTSRIIQIHTEKCPKLNNKLIGAYFNLAELIIWFNSSFYKSSDFRS